MRYWKLPGYSAGNVARPEQHRKLWQAVSRSILGDRDGIAGDCIPSAATAVTVPVSTAPVVAAILIHVAVEPKG
jgi:hypothetical protein